MRTQKELKPILEKELAKVWNEKMKNYCLKETAYIIELSDGSILTIEKPRIKKDFCFGYGMYLRSDDEEEAAADRMAEVARTNEDYFINENLAPLNEKIERLKKPNKRVYTYLHYIDETEGDLLKSYIITKDWETPDNEFDNRIFYGLRDIKELSEDDINLILQGLEEVKKKFIKRLETYLKKYGLSKVNSWSYLRD